MIESVTKSKKEPNLLGVFCVASGAMISSGLFILPGLAFANPIRAINYEQEKQ